MHKLQTALETRPWSRAAVAATRPSSRSDETTQKSTAMLDRACGKCSLLSSRHLQQAHDTNGRQGASQQSGTNTICAPTVQPYSITRTIRAATTCANKRLEFGALTQRPAPSSKRHQQHNTSYAHFAFPSRKVGIREHGTPLGLLYVSILRTCAPAERGTRNRSASMMGDLPESRIWAKPP